MLVSKMYRLLSVKYQLKIVKVEIWVKQYLTDINQYLNNIINILLLVKHWLISVKHRLISSWGYHIEIFIRAFLNNSVCHNTTNSINFGLVKSKILVRVIWPKNSGNLKKRHQAEIFRKCSFHVPSSGFWWNFSMLLLR